MIASTPISSSVSSVSRRLSPLTILLVLDVIFTTSALKYLPANSNEVQNGVAVRMALLTLTLTGGKDNEITD